MPKPGDTLLECTTGGKDLPVDYPGFSALTKWFDGLPDATAPFTFSDSSPVRSTGHRTQDPNRVGAITNNVTQIKYKPAQGGRLWLCQWTALAASRGSFSWTVSALARAGRPPDGDLNLHGSLHAVCPDGYGPTASSVTIDVQW